MHTCAHLLHTTDNKIKRPRILKRAKGVFEVRMGK